MVVWRCAGSVRRARAVGCALILVGALAGCVPSRYGVVLWPGEDNSSVAGELVRIRGFEEQERKVAVQNTRDERERLDEWRVERFDTWEGAEQFRAEYERYKDYYARCERQALPIRVEPNRFSEILYRLERGEALKVIGREDEKSDEGGLLDYWYQVATHSGTRGWVFGYYLTVFDVNNQQIAEGTEADVNITHFLNNVWRPDYFATMIAHNRFDLRRFNSGIGLFPAPSERRIALTTPHWQLFFNYRAPVPVDTTHFYFQDGEARLGVAVHSPSHVTVSFLDPEGAPVESDYYLLDDNIQSVVQRVRAERESLLSEILFYSRQFGNATYGTLSFVGGKRFRWSGGDALARYLPTNASTGRVAIDIELGEALASYDGVLSFYFDSDESAPLHCAFRTSSQGLTLSVVSPDAVQEYIATEVVAAHADIVMNRL